MNARGLRTRPPLGARSVAAVVAASGLFVVGLDVAVADASPSDATYPAMLQVLRAGVKDGRLDVLADMTKRAHGDRVRVSFAANSRRFRFTAPVKDGRVRFKRPLPTSQRRMATGIMTISYEGNDRVRPTEARLRAASGKARLDPTLLSLRDGYITARGSLTDRARGVVRLILSYERPNGTVGEWQGRAPIRDGNWRLNDELPADAHAGGYLSIQFTGDKRHGIRGEQIAKQLSDGQRFVLDEGTDQQGPDADDAPSSVPGSSEIPANVPTVPPPTSAYPPAPAPETPKCTTPAPYPSRLHTDPPSKVKGDVSRAFVDANGCKVRGNGVNVFAIWNDPVRLAAAQEDYDRIRAKGFTVVRLVMPWAWFEPEPGRWTNIGLLDQAIANARRAGLYVVLDPFHLHPSLPAPTWASGKDVIEQVQQHGRPWLQFVAARYRDDTTVAAYDLFNEPDPVDQNRALRMYNEMIGALRKVDPDKIAMISPPWGSSSMDKRFADERLLTHRRNVVHTVHDYYAGDGDASTVSSGYNAAGLPAGNFTWSTDGYPEPNDEADFAAHLAVQTDFAQRADVPMWIGEFGVDSAAPNSSEWVSDKIALYESLGLGRAWWMYKCGGTHAILLPSCDWNSLAQRLKP